MKKVFTIEWFEAAFIRAVRTVAQTMVAQIGTNTIGITAVDWAAVLSTSILAGILSMITSIAGLPEVSSEDSDDV